MKEVFWKMAYQVCSVRVSDLKSGDLVSGPHGVDYIEEVFLICEKHDSYGLHFKFMSSWFGLKGNDSIGLVLII